MQLINQLVRTCRLFDGMEHSNLEKQMKQKRLTARTYDATDYIDITDANALVCILAGSLDIMEMSEAGNLMLMEHFEKGACIGANTLFSKTGVTNVIGRTYTGLKVVMIHRDAVFDLLRRDTQFLKNFLELVSTRSTMLTRKISNLSFTSLEDKIMHYLEGLSVRQDTHHVRLYLSKKRLAELFGVARTSLSRRLSEMERKGLLEVRKDTIVLNPLFFKIHKKNFANV